MARKKIVAGNWKMNMTPSQAVKLVEELKPLVVSDDVKIFFLAKLKKSVKMLDMAVNSTI